MAMTQMLESVAPQSAEPRDSRVVPKDADRTRCISSVMPEPLAERIVIVSANPTSIDEPCRALEQDGYELSYATPETLPEIAGQLEFDLILVDMSTVPEDALALCRRPPPHPPTFPE